MRLKVYACYACTVSFRLHHTLLARDGGINVRVSAPPSLSRCCGTRACPALVVLHGNAAAVPWNTPSTVKARIGERSMPPSRNDARTSSGTGRPAASGYMIRRGGFELRQDQSTDDRVLYVERREDPPMTLSTALSPESSPELAAAVAGRIERRSVRSPSSRSPAHAHDTLAPARITTSVVAAIARIAPTRAASPSSDRPHRPEHVIRLRRPGGARHHPALGARASTMRRSRRRVESNHSRVASRVDESRVDESPTCTTHPCTLPADGPSLRLSDCDGCEDATPIHACIARRDHRSR